MINKTEKEIIGENFSYKIIRSKRKTVCLQVIKNGEVVVRAPYRFSEQKINDFVFSHRKWITDATRRQKLKYEKNNISDAELENLKLLAKKVIPEKVKYFSKIMNVVPSAVKINNAKTRFGSCSAKNSLNFSAYIMRYSEKALDYVVIHELAHIKYHNHSKDFIILLRNLCLIINWQKKS